MSLLRHIAASLRYAFAAVTNPSKTFSDLAKKSPEEIIFWYIRLLMLCAVIASAASFLAGVARAAYSQIFFHLDVQYLRLLNYLAGRSLALLFIYIFIGTLGVFLATFLLHKASPKHRYIEIVKITLVSLSPLLLFGWVPYAIPGLLPWSIFLGFLGIRAYLPHHHHATSLEQRD